MRGSKRDTEMMEDNKKSFCDGYPSNKIQQQHFLFFLCTDRNCANVKRRIDCVNHPSSMNK